MNNKTRYLAALVLGAVALSCAKTAENTRTSRSIRLLWLGSSSTYYHDAPSDLSKWIMDADIGLSAKSDLIGRSGTAVYKYLEPDFRFEYGLKQGQSVLERIRKAKYDVVILQVPTDYLAGRGDNDRDAFVAGLRTFVKVIREAEGKPIFYEQGWGEDELFDAGDKLLLHLARELDVTVAPCRSAWRRIHKERSDLELHNLPDRTHPGTLGRYVNLCCFYATIMGKSPVGLAYRESSYWPKLTDEQKKLASEKLKGMTITDEYVANLPSWMQRNSISARTVTLKDETARYFQKVAWESCLQWQRTIESSSSVKKD